MNHNVSKTELEKLKTKDVVKFALLCAEQVSYLDKSIEGIACRKVTKKWLKGKATEEECRAAADAVYAAATSTHAVYAAAAAAYAAAYAANAANAAAAAAYAAAYAAANVAANAANAAANAANAHAAYAAAYAADYAVDAAAYAVDAVANVDAAANAIAKEQKMYYKELLITTVQEKPKKREMKTSGRSAERLELANKLYEANKLLKEVSEIWSKLDQEEFFATGLCYPEYLPSFDEYVEDMDFWLDHMCNVDM